MKNYQKFLEKNNGCSIEVWGREYAIENSMLPSSVVSLSDNLLFSNMKITASENGRPIDFEDVTVIPCSFDGKKSKVCTTAQSDAFIVNTSLTFEDDGFFYADIKLMPKGYTVPQLFGLEKKSPPRTDLDYFYLDIPIKKEFSKLYHVYPNNVMPDDTGNTKNSEMYSGTGFLPSESFFVPFSSVVFIGNDEKGISIFNESDKNWQLNDNDKAIEFIIDEEKVVLRLHLLDSFPEKWKAKYTENGQYVYNDISYRIAFQASPVREFPKNPYTEKRLHIDCFKKISNDYDEFLRNPVVDSDREIGYNRIKRLGVTTLILHEKWNQIQNCWELTLPTQRRIKEIIEECHKRGIKVVLYFGYEISTLSDFWYDHATEYKRIQKDYSDNLFWYRFPAQREHPVCYHSDISNHFVSGLEKLVDEFDFDGVYLDGTAMVWECKNTNHGCGYLDDDGNLHPTYPIFAVRDLMKRVYDVFDSRNKTVNCHVSDCICTAAVGYCHGLWLGEYIQYSLVKHGAKSMPQGYLRSTHSGRNFGIPTEFIVYENKPIWSFDDAFAFSLPHGILPRPNDIGEPLEKISKIWSIIDSFPVEKSKWCPYFDKLNNPFSTDDDRIVASCYDCFDGKNHKYLLFVVNSTTDIVDNCSVILKNKNKNVKICDCSYSDRLNNLSFSRFESKIFVLEESR